MSKTNITVTTRSLVLTPTVEPAADGKMKLRFTCQENGHRCAFPENTTLVLKVTGPGDFHSTQEFPFDTKTGEATFEWTPSLSGEYSMNAVLVPRSEKGTEVSNPLAATGGTMVLAETGTDASRSAQDASAPVPVVLTRSASPATPDEILWSVIRRSSAALSFENYKRCIDWLLCGDAPPDEGNLYDVTRSPNPAGRTTLGRMDSYELLKRATEVFIVHHCCFDQDDLDKINRDEEEDRLGHDIGDPATKLREYLFKVADRRILPYLAIVAERIGDESCLSPFARECLTCLSDNARKIIRDGFKEKIQMPCFVELIWSYWHEEAMQTQAMNAILQRFQNRRASGDRDPLAQLELDPLRPLSNLMWGFVQDEMGRLSVLRRAHEYDHQYGITLHGKAIAELRSADRRSKFLESFHNLLYQCVLFYRQDDDTTVVSDGFPVLNAVKETHYLLAQGAHNQFGDLAVTARQEMLMEQYTLARPELGDFLRGRAMVAYPEDWMDRVDTVKTMKGWTDVSVIHFHDLAVFGEQILLSIRWNNWSRINDPNRAKNWARYWRQEIQGYIHAYRVVTGVDLAADLTAQSQQAERSLPPSVLLRRRLAAQHQTRG